MCLVRRVNYRLSLENRDLNWNIKLMELSIKLRDKSRDMVKEVLRLYMEGVITKDEVMDVIRISGIRLSKLENARRYESYNDLEIEDNNEELLEDYEDVVDEDYDEVNEEYVGERVLRRVFDHD